MLLLLMVEAHCHTTMSTSIESIQDAQCYVGELRASLSRCRLCLQPLRQCCCVCACSSCGTAPISARTSPYAGYLRIFFFFTFTSLACEVILWYHEARRQSSSHVHIRMRLASRWAGREALRGHVSHGTLLRWKAHRGRACILLRWEGKRHVRGRSTHWRPSSHVWREWRRRTARERRHSVWWERWHSVWWKWGHIRCCRCQLCFPKILGLDSRPPRPMNGGGIPGIPSIRQHSYFSPLLKEPTPGHRHTHGPTHSHWRRHRTSWKPSAQVRSIERIRLALGAVCVRDAVDDLLCLVAGDLLVVGLHVAQMVAAAVVRFAHTHTVVRKVDIAVIAEELRHRRGGIVLGQGGREVCSAGQIRARVAKLEFVESSRIWKVGG